MQLTIPSTQQAILDPDTGEPTGDTQRTADLSAIPDHLRPHVLRVTPADGEDWTVDLSTEASAAKLEVRLDAVAALATKADATAQQVAQAAKGKA